jgi:nicotinamide-nucleotide amidase
MMRAEILATGEEIRSGALVDSNSAHIARRLEEAGATVARIHAVGDDAAELAAVMREIGGRSEIAVVTGGLGPTVDDLTAAAAAAAAGCGLELSPAALESIEDFYRTQGRPMPASARRQALLPASAEPLVNRVGTAPGFVRTIGRCRFFFLPGVPREMRVLLDEHVLPRVGAALGGGRVFLGRRTLRCFGITESLADERLAGLAARFPSVRLGLRADFPEIQITLSAAAPDPPALARRLAEAAAWSAERLGDLVFSDAGETMAAAVGRLLRERGASLAVAESCTGGLIAHELTEVPGSSDYFRLSVVAYANAAKTRLLAVPAETIARFGAVSPETAREMAAGVKRLGEATHAVATSGIAGPGGGSPDKPVGTLCIGLASPGGAWGRRLGLRPADRSAAKRLFAMQALDLLRRELLGLPQR